MNARRMETVCEFAKNIFKLKGHKQIFHCAVQAAFYWWRFSIRTKGSEEWVGETEVFKVEQTSPSYSCEHGDHLQDPRLRRPLHKNVVEQAIHFWW